ncbi:nitroreductase family protein [Candidatus Fermentibacterales bacterium]|nr:nitroreductase family protein [Candidatus Fermentibacterales bacterium]
MNVEEAVRARRSIRAYAARPVERETLVEIMDLVRLAPSARNRQEWRFLVVDDPALIREIAARGATSGFVASAPVVVAAVATDSGYVMRCGANASDVDLAIALDHLQLLACSRGIGSCWLGSFDQEGVSGVLGLPSGARVVGLMTLGYPAESPEARPRKPLDDVLEFNSRGL